MSQPADAVESMSLVPGGRLLMGSGDFYLEEQPVVPVDVGDLWVDTHLVTNDDFARFVADTGWVTFAERALDPADFPGANLDDLSPGSQVFTPSVMRIPLHNWQAWWRWQPGASWSHPQGPESDVSALGRHPVVHVGWEDAHAYAEWTGKRLATEPEWEHAARGGLTQATYAWGNELAPDGTPLVNRWEGGFPFATQPLYDGAMTSPVETFPANGYGIFDATGNVWEWTASGWTPDHTDLASADRMAPPATTTSGCCGPGGLAETDRKVMKGGSHVCSPSYCLRYRPSARQGQGVRDSTSHLGFRCVRPA